MSRVQEARKYLNTSLPYLLIISLGSITLPNDFDILCPFSSTAKPWTKIALEKKNKEFKNSKDISYFRAFRKYTEIKTSEIQ